VLRQLGAECRVTDDLMRALHTLHGSARMAGAEAIAEMPTKSKNTRRRCASINCR